MKKHVKKGVRDKSRRTISWSIQHYFWLEFFYDKKSARASLLKQRRVCLWGGHRSNKYLTHKRQESYIVREDDYPDLTDAQVTRLQKFSCPDDPWDDKNVHVDKSWKTQSKKRRQYQ